MSLCDPMVTRQAPLSMGFSRLEHWSGLPSPGNLPNPGIEHRSPALQADSLPSEPPGVPHSPMKEADNLISTSWVRKLTYKEVNQLAQSHKSTKHQEKDISRGPAPPGFSLIHMYHLKARITSCLCLPTVSSTSLAASKELMDK